MSHKDKLSDEERKARRKITQDKYRLANKEKCVAASLRSRAKNPEEHRRKQAEYRARAQEKIKETSKKYREENRDRINASNRQWQIDNAEIFQAYQVAYRKENYESERKRSDKWQAENADREKARMAQWAKDNPDRRAINQQNRRARKVAAGGKLSREIKDRLVVLQKGKCACCRVDFSKSGSHLDHIMPLALGGPNDDENIQLLCPTCNLSKNAKHPVDFMQKRGFLL